MKKHRLIPVLLLRNGWLVQSKGFKRYKNLGNPTTAVKRLSEWGSDELIYLDISRDDSYDMRRDDQGYRNLRSFLEIIQDVASVTFMPMAVGGKIRSLPDIESRLALGADKVCLNTAAFRTPELIERAAREFGEQCIVVSMDARRNDSGGHTVFVEGGATSTECDAAEWARRVTGLGAGELLVNSIDEDGRGQGYDRELISAVASVTSRPVIACGGVGEWSHLADGLRCGADAVAAANIFHYYDQSVYLAKKHLHDAGEHVRAPDLLTITKYQ